MIAKDCMINFKERERQLMTTILARVDVCILS